MSDCLAKKGEVEKSHLHDKIYQEELQLNLDEVEILVQALPTAIHFSSFHSLHFIYPLQLATSVTELVQVLSPLIQQTQDLTEAVGEHLHLTLTLSELIKSQAAKSLASQQNRPAIETDQIQPMDN